MTGIRAVTYVGSAALMAWVASATSVPRQSAVPRSPKPAAEGQALGAIASDVQSQASRLRLRLATAPAPQAPIRNPFEFGAHEPPKHRAPVHVVGEAAPPPLPSEPPLALLGVAEQKTPKGLVRTAMIGGIDGQFVMVTEGDDIEGRYRVGAVGADTVELKDLASGVIRRLVMK